MDLRITDSLDLYISEIQKYPLLSPEEETRLALRWHDHKDTHAAHTLVTSNLRFVVKIAYEYTKYRLPLLDLIQEGNVGLIQAVYNFDPGKGLRLLTYAVYWIRTNIQRFIKKFKKIVKFDETRNFRKLFSKLGLVQYEELKGVDRLTALENVAKKNDIDQKAVEEVDNYLNCRYTNKVPNTALIVYTNFDEDLEKADQIVRIKVALEKLSDRQRFVIEKRYLQEDPVLLSELAKSLGVSKQRIGQIEKRSLDNVKSEVVAKYDKPIFERIPNRPIEKESEER